MKRDFFILCYILLFTIGILTFPGCATQSEVITNSSVVSADIIDYGVFKVPHRIVKLPESITGTAKISDGGQPKFTLRSHDIPAVLGTGFGFSYRVNGAPMGAKVVLNHRREVPKFKNVPEKILADYQKRLGRSYEGFHLSDGGFQVPRKIGGIFGCGYSFDKPFELEPGTWTFQVVYQDRVLAEMSFNVYLP